MNRRRLLLGLAWLLLVVMLVCFFRLKRQSAPSPAPGSARIVSPAQPPVDLTHHNGETIDFSSGQPVVKNTPADKAALDQAVKEMDEAAKDVTFAPAPPSTADRKPVAPPP